MGADIATKANLVTFTFYLGAMNTHADDSDGRPLSVARGCMGCLVLALLLLLGSCLAIEVRDRQKLRANLPPQLEPSFIVSLNVCSRVFGGYSYVLHISPDAVENLRRRGSGWLAQPKGRPVELDKVTPWRSSVGWLWGDGPPPGLQCLREWKVGGQRISQHIFRKGGYYRSYHHRQGDYIIPSLGIVVGGFDPR